MKKYRQVDFSAYSRFLWAADVVACTLVDAIRSTTETSFDGRALGVALAKNVLVLGDELSLIMISP
jgi:hypothetical protein